MTAHASRSDQLVPGPGHELLQPTLTRPISTLPVRVPEHCILLVRFFIDLDIYGLGVNDDYLSLIYQANKDVKMAENTPSGLTERQILKNVVFQGDTFGSILAFVHVDSIGKEVEDSVQGQAVRQPLGPGG